MTSVSEKLTSLNLMNCTSQDIVLYSENSEDIIVEFPKATIYVAHLEEEHPQKIGHLTTKEGFSIPVYSPQKVKKVQGLPLYEGLERCSDIIVSSLVGEMLQKTQQWPGAVYGPDSAIEAVLLDKRQILKITCLIQYCARKALNPKNLLDLPGDDFGTAGIESGNTIKKELSKIGLYTFFNEQSGKIVISDSSLIQPSTIYKALYPQQTDQEIDEDPDSYVGYALFFPIIKTRDIKGNLEVTFASTLPTFDENWEIVE